MLGIGIPFFLEDVCVFDHTGLVLGGLDGGDVGGWSVVIVFLLELLFIFLFLGFFLAFLLLHLLLEKSTVIFLLLLTLLLENLIIFYKWVLGFLLVFWLLRVLRILKHIIVISNRLSLWRNTGWIFILISLFSVFFLRIATKWKLLLRIFILQF